MGILRNLSIIGVVTSYTIDDMLWLIHEEAIYGIHFLNFHQAKQNNEYVGSYHQIYVYLCVNLFLWVAWKWAGKWFPLHVLYRLFTNLFCRYFVWYQNQLLQNTIPTQNNRHLRKSKIWYNIIIGCKKISRKAKIILETNLWRRFQPLESWIDFVIILIIAVVVRRRKRRYTFTWSLSPMRFLKLSPLLFSPFYRIQDKLQLKA